MPNIQTVQRVQCDECERWYEMEVDKDYSTRYHIEFKYPTKWFIFRWKETKGFCSWECVAEFVATQQAKEAPIGEVRRLESVEGM